MPVRNTAPFLPACLDSIRSQTYPHWELLATDNASDDESLTILNEYARLDPRIRVSQNPVPGVIPTLRESYRMAGGQLITRMDSDDRMAPFKLERLRQVLTQAGPGHVATGWVEYFSEEPLGQGYRKYADWLNELARTGRGYEEIYRECVIPSPCWMCYRSDLEACQAFEPDTYPEDYDLCFRFYQQGLRVVSALEVLHYWRDHPQRSSRTDPHYLDNSYLHLKLPWFLKLDRDRTRALILWGAGKKGKTLARMLEAREEPFTWITNNPAKWGQRIVKNPIRSPEDLPEGPRPQVIAVVANPDDRAELVRFFQDKGLEYFLFC